MKKILNYMNLSIEDNKTNPFRSIIRLQNIENNLPNNIDVFVLSTFFESTEKINNSVINIKDINIQHRLLFLEIQH